MNTIIKYLVETVEGGSVVKIFDTLSESNKYYNDNIRYNAHQYTLIPFQCEGDDFYYSVGNCIGVYNSYCEWITKLYSLDVKNFTIDRLCECFKEWYDNWELPY